VECEDYRELLSARLDGEEDVGPNGPPDAHLERCFDCQLWYDRAALITRRARMAPAQAGPDVTAAVLERVPRIRSSSSRRLRSALVALGVAQCLMAFFSFMVGDETAGLTHVSYESVAWNLALGVALVAAALRPGHGAGMVPVLGTFITVMTGVFMADLLPDRVEPTRVVSHLITLAALVILLLIARVPGLGQDPVAHLMGVRRARRPVSQLSDVIRIDDRSQAWRSGKAG
jgi:predicted anti-sigma-YlaC factor YlaD